MKLAHIYSRLIATPWFVNEATLSAITQLLQSRMNGGGLLENPAAARRSLDKSRAGSSQQRDITPAALALPVKTGSAAPSPATGTAVIPVFGVLGKHLSELETMCGGCDMGAIRQSFDAAMADPAIKQVVLYFDSPGGMATGCHELFTHMVNAKTKPLYAYTDTVCASAAYYLAAASDAIFAAPTARVGSVGTMLLVVDESAKNAAEGVKFTIFRSGAHKGLGDPSQPLTEQQTGILQGLVDQLGTRFRTDVSSARPSIAAADMEGLAYLGTEAKAKGFVDDVANDLPALLAALA